MIYEVYLYLNMKFQSLKNLLYYTIYNVEVSSEKIHLGETRTEFQVEMTE